MMLNIILFILIFAAYSFLLAHLSRRAGRKQDYNEGFMDGIIEEHNKSECESIKNFVEPTQNPEDLTGKF